MVRPRRSVREGGQTPVHLDEVEIEYGSEETLPPLPPVSGEANEGGHHSLSFQAYALFPTMQITSLVKARRQDDQGLNHLFKYRYSGTSIGTPLEISLVSIHGKEYRYPSSLMELEYRYWLSSTGTGCLRTVFGVP
ncbi:hypothetical protein GQ457_14G000880 [Hibiscus cannabinus]